MEYSCPNCGKKFSITFDKDGNIKEKPGYFPFCSERCRLVDLNAWMDGDYIIPTSLNDRSDNHLI